MTTVHIRSLDVSTATNEPLGRARVEGGDGTIPVRTDEMGQYRVVGVCSGQVELIFKSNYGFRSVKLTIAGDSYIRCSTEPNRAPYR